MSAEMRITGLGHAGDGIAEDGRYVPFTAPGDLVSLDERGNLLGLVEPGPHRSPPPCTHFGRCGGCALQHLDTGTYRAFKRDQIAQTLSQRGFEKSDIAAVRSVPPQSRRRAALRARKREEQTLIGFNARASHDIVDMQECHVLTPALFACVTRLRAVLNDLLCAGEQIELHLTEAGNGIDLALRWKRARDPDMIAALAASAGVLDLCRITEAGEIMIQREAPQLRIGKADVRLPPQTFLQPTRIGEAWLLAQVRGAAAGAKRVADLFCGIGTFALPLAETQAVHAYDSDDAMILALQAAVRATQGIKPLMAEKRDLFRRPLSAAEFSRIDCVVMDPPRAGAKAQSAALAQSKVPRIVYVSCNPASFSRDARLLTDGGYRLRPIVPVDQFLWSAELELVAVFDR